MNLGNVQLWVQGWRSGPSAFAHRLYNGFGLWPFEASGFQVAGAVSVSKETFMKAGYNFLQIGPFALM